MVLGMADFEDLGLLTLLSNAGPRGACAGASWAGDRAHWRLLEYRIKDVSGIV